METVLAYLNRIYPLPETCLEGIREVLKVRYLSRKDMLLHRTHVCSQVYFIEQGLLRCYYKRGDAEICSWFMKEGDIVISVESFYKQQPSREAIQALEDTVLWYVSYKDLQQLYKTYPEFNTLGRILTERYYVLSEQRAYALRMMRAGERYAFLVEQHPDLVARVPNKYIASYLGIAEETMSRIRAQR